MKNAKDVTKPDAGGVVIPTDDTKDDTKKDTTDTKTDTTDPKDPKTPDPTPTDPATPKTDPTDPKGPAGPKTDDDKTVDPPVDPVLERTDPNDWDLAFLEVHNKIRQDPKSLIPSLEAIVKDFEYSSDPLTRKARVNGKLVNLKTKEGAKVVKELIG